MAYQASRLRRIEPELERQRWRLRWTQGDMAAFLGLTLSAYHRWVKLGVPARGTGARLCDFALVELKAMPEPRLDQGDLRGDEKPVSQGSVRPPAGSGQGRP